MPANVSPEYKKARDAFQRATSPADRLASLKEMLRTIPKHKGTEHLQADIKTRIKQLTAELAGPRKGGARTGPAQTVPRDGAAQIALVGPPNSGKSTLHVTMTGSHAETGPYPHTTQAAMPGMFAHENVQFQIVDLPPIDADFMEPWMSNALQPADAVLLVVDLGIAGCVESVAAIVERLEGKRVALTGAWPGPVDPALLAAGNATAERDEEDDDPFRVTLPTLLVANKRDLNPDADEIEVLEELAGVRFPAVSVSATTGDGIAAIGTILMSGLEIVRVYTKIPGHAPEMDRPFTVTRGATVADVAVLVHREIAESMKFARVWGGGKFDGQQVGRDHVVSDGDILEFHA